MTGDRFDERLRRAFGALRAAEHRATPPLERMLRHAPDRGPLQRPQVSPRPRVRWPLAWAAATLAMLVAGATWLGGRPPSPARTERVLAEWRRLEVASWDSPTRFLLETPGHAVLTGMPRFDEPGRVVPVLHELPLMQLPSTRNPRRNDT